MSQRPPTTKPRGVCTYFQSRSGCRNGTMCKFLHGDGETVSPYDKSKACKFYAAGFCKRGVNCWFQHVLPENGVPTADTEAISGERATPEAVTEDGGVVCSICHEKPVTYGLLEDCSHVFCLECIRGWRDPHCVSIDLVNSGVTKKCPYCRALSKFVTPSSIFYPSEDPLKATIIANYKASMARIPCKYFERSPSAARFCPFGKDCFYQHKEADGTMFEFDRGADFYMKKPPRQNRDTWNVDVPFDLRSTRAENIFIRALTELSSQVESTHQPNLEELQDAVGTDLSELGRFLSDALAQFSDVFEIASEDEQVEEGETAASRPSILATPEDSTTASALPLTRAFLDTQMRSESVDLFEDVYGSETGDSFIEQPSAQTSLLQSHFRHSSLTNISNSRTDERGVRADLVEEPRRSRSNSMEQATLERPTSHTSDDGQDRLIVDASSSSEEPEEGTDSLASSDISTLRATSNDAVDAEPRSSEVHPTQPADNLSTDSADHLQECELDSKPEARSELTSRRTKSCNSTTPYVGRRNVGHSFVTDGRGRVVATDDWTYSDTASQAFWPSLTSVVALPADSPSETNVPTSVGLGALDDLD